VFLVFTDQYKRPFLFFTFQRPDIGRRLANMPVESYVTVRGWVYPRPPGQRNVVNVFRIVPKFYICHPVVLDILTREIIAVNTTSKCVDCNYFPC
jgi:hypothetical protein